MAILDDIAQIVNAILANPAALAVLGLVAGGMLTMFAIARNKAEDAPVLDRMRAVRESLVAGGRGRILKTNEVKPEGLFKALLPQDQNERLQIRMQLAQAGFDGPMAVRNFFMLRLCLALIGPVILVGLVAARNAGTLPEPLQTYMTEMENLRLLQILMVSAAAGFYGPGYWLKGRISDRKRRIEEGFPNALDLLQISAAAGMGLDAAMQRVGTELLRVCPEIGEEFLLAQREVLAGRNREQTLYDMADRMGIEEAKSFVNEILQSLQYGTSISDALVSYAAEMRETREMRAHEKANKLPVQMSAVMATLMLPALLLITLGPTVIRYMRLY